MNIFISYLLAASFLLGIMHSSNGNDEEKKVLCYFSNQAFDRPIGGKFEPEDIDPSLCTHIVYSYAVLDSDSVTPAVGNQRTDVSKKLYKQVTAYRKNGIKVLISLRGSDTVTPRLLTESNTRAKFIKNVAKFIEKHNFDGLDLDFHYSGEQEKQGFTELVKELSEAFKSHGWLLSATVGATQKIIDSAYDVSELSKYLDWFALQTFDYCTNADGQTGPTAALYSSDHLSVDFTVNYFIEKGAPSKKLIVGIPSYAQTFTLNDPENNGINAPSTGPGQPGLLTNDPGKFSYYEICFQTKRKDQLKWTVVPDAESKQGPYAYRNNQWTSFEDVQNVHAKGQYIREKSLGGGWLSTLDYDDFNGNCNCGKYPLLTALNQELRSVGDAENKNCI